MLDRREMLVAIIKAENKTFATFAKMIGVEPIVIEKSYNHNSCSDKLVSALNKYYGGDFSYLQRPDQRTLYGNGRGRKNAH